MEARRGLFGAPDRPDRRATYAAQAGHAHLKPAPGSADSLQYQYWMHYAEGSLMPLMLLSLVFLRMPRAPMPFFVPPIVKGIADRARSSFVAPQIATRLAHVERALAERDWFAGSQLTAADIQMSFSIEAAVARAGLDARLPKLTAFRARPPSRDSSLVG